MENNPSNQPESLWRQKLTTAEKVALRAQPELELEARLTSALGKIPDVPVPSNFSARILGAIQLEDAQAARSRGWTLNWRRFLPRIATAAAILVFTGISLHRFTTNTHQALLAKNVAQIASAAQPPSVDALENLEAIQTMSLPAPADGELLAVLQ